jgi:hypothetical protein
LTLVISLGRTNALDECIEAWSAFKFKGSHVSNVRLIKLLKMEIPLSQNTIDAFASHESFISAGEKWLIRNDPKGILEMEHLDRISEAVRIDVEEAIKHMSFSRQDAILEELYEMSTEELHDACV